MRVTYPALLLSLHPEFARKIYSGKKTAELRRVKPSRSIRYVLVYETAPVGRVTGWFRVRSIESGTARAIWSKYARRLSITRPAFDRYLKGCPRPTVLMIERRARFRRHLPLEGVCRLRRPPQSFSYIHSRPPT
jgi:predicted transcriptional regulator